MEASLSVWEGTCHMQDSTAVHLNKLVSTWLHNQTDKGENTVYSHTLEPVFLPIPTTFDTVWNL